MPGVLQIEALAQSGCILLLKRKVDDPSTVLIVFSGVRNAKFRKPVVPGDQIRMEVELADQRRNFYTMKGRATVDGKLVCEIEATAALVPKDKI